MLISDSNSDNFNSYASKDDLTAFALTRDIAIPVNKEEILLIKAMDYLNGLKWIGRKTNPEQPLSFPRKGVILNGDMLPSDKIPKQLITAQCMLAVEAIDGDLLSSIREAPIKSESVDGVVSVSYAVNEAGFKPQFLAVKSILGDLVIKDGFTINCTANRG